MVVLLVAVSFAVVVPLAALRSSSATVTVVPGQIGPGPPTTPQPTVPCDPVTGCGHAPGTQRDVAFAWIDRYCNGDAVATPPGFTTFSVNYGLGGQSSGPVQFFGVATANGVVVPTSPLAILQPGQQDTRVRTAVVPNGVVFEITVTGTVIATGQPVIFGNGTDVRVRTAAGACPDAPAVVPGFPSLPPPPVVPGAPPATGGPPGSGIPPAF